MPQLPRPPPTPCGIRLTEEIRDDLMRKVELFVNRSEEERDKIVIFTDDASLWTDFSDPSIRLDVLPPIPEDYKRQAGYDIVREMSEFIRQYTTYKKYTMCWCLAERGEEDQPKVHVLLYEKIACSRDTVPIYQSENVLHSDKPRDVPPTPFYALPLTVRAAMWRQHHADSTLNDVSSSIFSSSLSSVPSTPGSAPGSAPGPVPKIVVRRPSTASVDSQFAQPADSEEVLHDGTVFNFDDVPGPSGSK